MNGRAERVGRSIRNEVCIISSLKYEFDEHELTVSSDHDASEKAYLEPWAPDSPTHAAGETLASDIEC